MSDSEQPAPVAPARDPAQPWRYRTGRSWVSIGRFTYGAEQMTINHWRNGANLSIGAFCSIARGVKIFLGGNHRVDWSTTFPFGHIYQDLLVERSIKGHPATKGDIVIGNDVWISDGTTIFSGVTIGDGAVIAGNATVTRDVGPYEIWGGNPAQLIRTRFQPEITRRLHATRWWDCSVETIRQLAPLLSQPPEPNVLGLIEDLVRCDRQKKDGPGEPGPSQG